MKYMFNKMFPTLKKPKENAGKSHFDPDLDLLGPSLGHKLFFGSFSSIRC